MSSLDRLFQTVSPIRNTAGAVARAAATILIVTGFCVFCVGRPASAADEDGVSQSESQSASQSASPAGAFELEAWLDEQFNRHWAEAGVEVELCDDALFLRRVYLDLVGRIPSVAEVRDFLNDASAGKRSRLVDRLLADPETSSRSNRDHAEHMSRIWRRMMIPPGSNGALNGRAFDTWLNDQFRENVSYDELARRLVTGGDDSSAVYYQSVGGTPEAYAGEFTRMFLGVRIACAQCHDHPFADWKQQDFWGMAAFFGDMQQQNANNLGGVAAGRAGVISYEGVEYPARVLWSNEPTKVSQGKSPREALAAWMTSPENPNFSATAVNRVWQHLFGRGLVPGVNDLDLATSEERKVLLDKLAKKFADSGFDMRWLIAGIAKSRVYQCRTVAGADEDASPWAARRPLKTLTPEQLFDSLEQALMLPVSRTADDAARHNGGMMQVLTRLDESAGATPEDYSAGVPQVLMLMNGPLMSQATDLENSRTLRAVVEAPFLEAPEKVETLYMAAFTRRPTPQEKTVMLRHVERQTSPEARRKAYGEIFWAVLNSPEFVLCR